MATAWPRAYWRMVAWDLADLRMYIPVLSAVLLLQGAGFALGVGLLFGQMPKSAAVFLVTGAPVMNLITAGLIFEPQLVAQQRIRGSYEFLQALPVPRSAAALAWYTVALITALPPVALTLAVGAARYHISLAVTPVVVPAMLLTCLTGVLLGLAVAHGVTVPMAAELLSTTLIFVMFGFSPVAFPAGTAAGLARRGEPVAAIRVDGDHRSRGTDERGSNWGATRLPGGGRVGSGFRTHRGVGAGPSTVAGGSDD